MSRDGDTLYVTGGGIDEDADYATIAHDAATGRQRWVARHDGFGDTDSARALAVSPDDATVYVTGFTRTGTSLLASDYATLAYDATTGDDRPAFVPWDLRAAPPVGLADGAVQVSVDVANVGTAGGDYAAVLEVAGQPAQSTEVPLESGATTRVSWAVTRQQPGTYQLRVGHLTAQLRVIACAETITGTRLGLTVSDGVTCLADGARVVGPVRVHEGAGLVSTAATITGPVTATGADVVRLDATRITGPIRVTGTTGGLMLTGNRVTGVVGLHDNATGDTRIVVSNNIITGRLSCTGNAPAPVDDGEPNPVTGRKSGQCADL